MTVNKPSQLDLLVQKIASQGARYQPAIPGGFLVAVGCLGLLLCSWGIASSLLQIIAPAGSIWLPRCPGNPHANLIALSFLLVPSCLAILLGRWKTDAILVNDTDVRFFSRFGRQVILTWREVREKPFSWRNFSTDLPDERKTHSGTKHASYHAMALGLAHVSPSAFVSLPFRE
jgi:hypothetical protein